MPTATEVRKVEEGPFGPWSGDARLYKLSEPVSFSAFQEEATSDFLLVSAIKDVEDFTGTAHTETAIWLANEDGQIKTVASFSTLPGAADHKAALEAAGVTLVEPETAAA